jgi:protein-L-isoaspartate(D-aspartate) O-methyltransferase
MGKKWALIPAILLSLSCATLPTDTYKAQRYEMVREDIEARGVHDRKVLEAMRQVPRHRFVPPGFRHRAYADHPLPIGSGQTISQPYIVALMTEMLQPKATDRVLEIGTGSGYQAAVLAEIVKQVYSIEIHKALADSAGNLLRELGYENVRVKHGDGYFGWPEHGPFDAIMITAAAVRIPQPLVKQLKDGGRMVLPLDKNNRYQELTLFIKQGEKNIMKEMGAVIFVPMTGEVKKEAEQ